VTTPDRFPGPRIEEELELDTNLTPVGGSGSISFDGSKFNFIDSLGTFDPRFDAKHRIIRQLIHFIDDGPCEGFASLAYRETTYSGIFPTSEIWWESSSKLKKIVSLNTTWTGILPTQEVWKIYDTDGSTVLATITDNISYSGVFETSRTRTIA
jgi:hypothetical protein